MCEISPDRSRDLFSLKNFFTGTLKGPKPTAAEPEEYNGYRIFAEPSKEAGGYRIAARIEKDFGGETKTHMLIRADTISDPDEAITATVSKAKHVIDQQGDLIF